MQEAREAWVDGRLARAPERLIFIDETAATTQMARLSGRAPRGERGRAAVPHGHGTTTTFTAGRRLSSLAAPMILDGAPDGDACRADVEKILVPELNPGAGGVLDNLPAHRVGGIREAIEAAGAALLSLPPDSPDFNPIERAFATRKAILKGAAPRTIPDLWRVITDAIDRVTPDECRAHFTAAGHEPA